LVINNKIFKVKKNPFVDVIMPNYNKSQYLEESINSIIYQDYKNWNLIIIDNASTDDSKKVLDKFKSRYDKIKVVYLKKNKGVSFSRNLGMRLSKGEYLAFLDSDDYWAKGKLSEQINFMQKYNHVFTYTDFTPFISKNNVKIFKKKVIAPNNFKFEQFLNDTSISTSSMMLKKSSIKTIKFPIIKNFEDYFFKCKILKEIKFATNLNLNMMYYRITKNSLSSNRFRNAYWLFYINMRYNKLSIFRNMKSLLLVSLSSIKKYGLK